MLNLVNQFRSVQSISDVQLFAILWTATRQASLSITNCRNLFKLLSIKLVMLSSHLSGGACRLYGRANSNFKESLHQGVLPGNTPTHASAKGPPTLAGWPGSVSVGSLLLSPGSCPPRVEFLFIPVLWKSCNQIMLAFKVRISGDSQPLC